MGQLSKHVQALMPAGARRGLQALRYYANDRSALKAARPVPLPDGFLRIYHHHIRRSSGTSLNAAFFNTGGEDFRAKEPLLTGQGWMVHGGRVFVAHNKFLIERGDYFFARSHTPAHDLRLPLSTFTITVLRDPVARVVSHYNLLSEWESKDIRHPSRAAEGPWLGASFTDFLARMPREHLFRQLFTFSPQLSVDEAGAALAKVDAILFCETLGDGLGALGRRLGLDLALFHEKASTLVLPVSDADRSMLRDLLEPEYALIAGLSGARNVYAGPAAAVATASSG
ncbi:MAG TPA: hypothetical protein VLR47_00625 [Rhodospirillales bacterium]|nr:hypothetical protein [Rhodospirillales bacterium]